MGKVLVVDNHEGVAEVIAKMLRALFGYESDLAESLEEAAAAISLNEYHLLITNYRLNGESGGEILIRTAKSTHRGIKIILMSSYEGDIEVAKAAGADAFIRKAFGLDELRKVMKAVMGI